MAEKSQILRDDNNKKDVIKYLNYVYKIDQHMNYRGTNIQPTT